MAQDPNELLAGFQQSSSGEPERPLTRREIRAREAQLAEDLLAEELERQVDDYHMFPVVKPSPLDGQTEMFPEPEPKNVFSEGFEQEIVLRRDRSNRPPLASPSPEIVPTATQGASPQHNTTAPISLVPQAATVAPQPSAHGVKLSAARRVTTPRVVTPPSRKRRGAQIFSMVAMAFVAGLAIATSIPANALLSPEQIAVNAEQSRVDTQHIGDGQSVAGTGEIASAGRDGISVTAAQAVPTSGAYSVKRMAVNVPPSTNGMRWPVDEVKISSPFGSRSLYGSYNFHTGLDFDPAYGTPIYAVADGIVSLVENPGPTCGVAVFIEHNVDGTKFTSVYCHMVIGSPTVTAGESVKKGDFVGNIGLTGITTGPHLHLEIRVNDAPIDPYAFLLQHAGKAPNEVRD